MKSWRILLASIALVAVSQMTVQADDNTIPFKSTGVNAVYSPATGDYFAPGVGTPVGRHDNAGTVELTETDNPLVLKWRTDKRHVITDADGDQIFLKGGGTVELIPLGGDQFFAEWGADFEVKQGTGKYQRIKKGEQPLRVTAVNDPFTFPPGPDDIWTFSWDITGEVELRDEETVPFIVFDGDGNIPALPGINDPKPYSISGNATFLGAYFAAGDAQLDEFTTPLTANFSSDMPTVFIGEDGSELAFDFDGIVILTPEAGGQFSTRWEAEFTPVVGANTGDFADVQGGSMLMTARTGPIFLDDMDIPFTWSGCGHLVFDDDD